jgi:magnesium transporter
MARYDLIAICVVDDENRLVGIVTHDDVMDAVVEEATEDVQKMGGVGPLDENYLEASFAKVWRKRASWLSLLFVAGLFTIMALSRFQNALAEVLVLTLFIPLCIGTGGNSGSQAATLVTRALALGHLTARDWFRVLRHEVLMGLALGISLGFMGFLICFILPESVRGTKIAWWQLGLVVSQAVVVICLWGTLVGSMLPLAFRALGFDPAVASSPFVAIFVDVTGIVLYFTIATLWIPGVTF